MDEVWQLVAILVQMPLHRPFFDSRSIHRVDPALDRDPINLACVTDGEPGDHGFRDLSVVLLFCFIELGFFRSETFRAQSSLRRLKELGMLLGDLVSERCRRSTDDDDRRIVDEQSRERTTVSIAREDSPTAALPD
jgi:hypothetical protein